MAVDRQKYRASSSEELKNETEKVQELVGNDQRGAFIKIEPGINKIRFFPAPLKSKSTLFRFPKVTSFLPFIVDEVDKDGNKTGKQERKRKAIFNARVHGNLEHDIVDEYIETAKEYFESTCKSRKEAFEKLKPLTDWKTGIKASSAWISYGYRKVGQKKHYGRIQITDGVNKQLDVLSTREDREGQPIVVDLYSHPDTGKMIQWFSDPNNADAKSKNKISVIFEEDAALTDEELEALESWPSLESLYKNSYMRVDFKKQLQGLQLFDKEQKLGIFDSSAFQSKIEMCKEEIEEKLPEDNEGEEGSSGTDDLLFDDNSTSSNKKQEEDLNEIPTILEQMDKKTLNFIIKTLELETDVKVITPPSKMRIMIKEAIIAAYELEGNNSEINEAITNIIEGATSDEDSEDKEENENDSEYGEDPTINDNDDGEENDESKQEEEKQTPKKSKLMSKYGKK